MLESLGNGMAHNEGSRNVKIVMADDAEAQRGGHATMDMPCKARKSPSDYVSWEGLKDTSFIKAVRNAQVRGCYGLNC